MKTILVGSGPGVLVSALALNRDSHQVLVVGDHGQPTSGYERGDLSILDRSGILSSTSIPKSFEDRIQKRRVFLVDNKKSTGFTIDNMGSDSSVFLREDLRKWLVREVQSTEVSLKLNEVATGLLRRENTVVGVTTRSGQLAADVVYVSENAFGWLTRNEEYSFSLPDKDPHHIVNLQASVTRSNSSGIGAFPIVEPNTVTSLLLSAKGIRNSETVTPFIQIFPAGERIVFDLFLTRTSLREREVAPDDLLNQVLASPVFKGISIQEDPTMNLRLLPSGGWSRRATLCEHGLALGGTGAGLMALWPDFDTIGPALRSGYQFARTISHLDRQGKFPGRDRLKKYYERPLSEGTIGQQMKRDEPMANWFREKGSISTDVASVLLAPEGPSIPDLPSPRTVLNKLTQRNLTKMKELISPTVFSEWFQLICEEGLNHFVPFLESPSESVTKHTEPNSRWSSLFLGLISRFWQKTLSSSSTAGHVSTEALLGLIEILENLHDKDRTMDSASSTVEKHTYRIPDKNSGANDGSPNIHASVKNSLQANPEPFRVHETLCPSDVFNLTYDDRDRPEFEWNADKCVRCGLCRLGSSEIEFYSSVGPERSSSELPESYRTSVHDLFDLPDTEVPDKFPDEFDVLGKVCRRLGFLLENIRNEPYRTPESRSWMEGQLNLIRTVLNEEQFSEVFCNFINYVAREIRQIRRLIARERDRFAHEKIQILQRFLDDLVPREMDETNPSDLTSFIDHLDGPGSSKTRRSTNRQILVNFLQSLRDYARDNLPPRKQSQDQIGVGFLPPGRQDRVKVISDDVPDRILMNTEFGTRIFKSDQDPREVPIQFGNNLQVIAYHRDDLEPVESDAFVPDQPETTIEPFLDSFYELLLGMVRRESVRIRNEMTNFSEDLRIGHLEALSFQLKLLLHQENESINDHNIPLIYRFMAGAELLLGSTLCPVMSYSSVEREQSVSDASLIRALIGTPGDLAQAERETEQTPEELLAVLSLSEDEEERWEMADTSGIIHDAVRQWRTTLGTVRRVLHNQEGTKLQRTLFIARTWACRQSIDSIQRQINKGNSPRKAARALDIMMKRLYWSRHPFDDPERNEPDLSGPSPVSSLQRDEAIKNIEKLSKSILSINKPSFNREINQKFYQFVQEVLEWIEVDWIEGRSLKQEFLLLLIEFRDLLQPHLVANDRYGVNSGVHLALGPALRWHRRFCGRIDEIESTGTSEYRHGFEKGQVVYGRLLSAFWQVTRRSSLREDVIRRTANYCGKFPSELKGFFEDQTVESVQRSLEWFEPPLSERPNLRGLWAEYLQLMGKLEVLKQLEQDGGLRDSLPERVFHALHEQFEKDVQSHSKLFNHGIRGLRSDREPAETQILDLIRPGSVFRRRYSRDI